MTIIPVRCCSALLLAILLSAGVRADALFESHDAIDLTMQASFGQIRRERDKSKSYPGTLKAGGQSFVVEVGVRGNNRLKRLNCSHPPLSIRFDEKEIEDTIFDHQKSLKLVVQCKKYGSYRDLLRKEYLVYRLFNLATDLSYRVRWLDLNYLDEDGEKRTEPAFFIERKSRVAKRAGLEKTDISRIKYTQLESKSAAMVALFQYIVANTDYSVVVATEGECCHNAKILLADGGEYTPIIYDFDSSGLVDAEYAKPNVSIRQKKVTDRVFRGYCRHLPELQVAREQLLSLEPTMMTLMQEDKVLSSKAVKKATTFLRKSFSILREDEHYEKYIVGKCRGEP
ncbi:MAG: hypothetical protein ACI9GW_003676 [Halieaceae bacterium]|jgi:hypothetical protein